MELDAFAQFEGVGQAVLGNLPGFRQVALDLSLSCGPVNISSVEYCGATGCTIANVVVAWQSVVGGSATTAKLSTPPRLGVIC